MPMTSERLQEHLAQAEQHIAEMKRRIAKQRQVVGALPLESRVRDDAIQTLGVLTDHASTNPCSAVVMLPHMPRATRLRRFLELLPAQTKRTTRQRLIARSDRPGTGVLGEPPNPA